MGIWGTAISSNDTYADTYGTFFDLYNKGLSVSEVSAKLITQNKEVTDIESNNFWFALAQAQWECKELDSKIFDRVKQTIETGDDINIWRQMDASEKEIKKRKIVLEKFLLDLKTERLKAKARKTKSIRQPVFEKGDCLTFKLENGNYGGAVVLEAIFNTEYGHNLIAVTRINQKTKPIKRDFEKAEVLIINYAMWEDKPQVVWYLPTRHKNIADLVEKVTAIEIQINYDLQNSMHGFIADFDIHVIQTVNKQLNSELFKPCPTVKQTVRQLTKKNKWGRWGLK